MVCPTDVQIEFIANKHNDLSHELVDAINDIMHRHDRYRNCKSEKRKWANGLEYEVKVLEMH